MVAYVEVSDEMDDVVEEVIQNVKAEIGIKINKKTLIPMVFGNPKEITDIVLREIKSRIKV